MPPVVFGFSHPQSIVKCEHLFFHFTFPTWKEYSNFEVWGVEEDIRISKPFKANEHYPLSWKFELQNYCSSPPHRTKEEVYLLCWQHYRWALIVLPKTEPTIPCTPFWPWDPVNCMWLTCEYTCTGSCNSLWPEHEELSHTKSDLWFIVAQNCLL